MVIGQCGRQGLYNPGSILWAQSVSPASRTLAFGLTDDCGPHPPALQGQEQQRGFYWKHRNQHIHSLAFNPESEAFDSRLCHLQGARRQGGRQPACRTSAVSRVGRMLSKQPPGSSVPAWLERLRLAAARQFLTPGRARPRQWGGVKVSIRSCLLDCKFPALDPEMFLTPA